MLGQVATFIDSLHLTYEEVFEKIPYRNLVIMQKDKMRVAYNGVKKKISGREAMTRRMQGRTSQ